MQLNRFNKFAWSQCQKSLQRGRISPFLPLVIQYLRRDVAYMKPVLLRKYRTLLETIWKASHLFSEQMAPSTQNVASDCVIHLDYCPSTRLYNKPQTPIHKPSTFC